MSHHTASPRTCADLHRGSTIRDGCGNRIMPREHGHCELGHIAVTIAVRKAGSPLLPFFPLCWHERWFWTRFCLMALPLQMCHGNNCCLSPLVKGSQPHSAHRLTVYSLYNAIGVFTSVFTSYLHKWFYLYGRCLATCLNFSCLNLSVPDA